MIFIHDKYVYLHSNTINSPWAFSAIGAIESRSAIKNGQTGSDIVELSAQQLVGMLPYAFLAPHQDLYL